MSKTYIRSEAGKLFNLSRQLTCKDHGIYAATCMICSAQYVGQTVTSFSERCGTHRSLWKSGNTENNDRAALRVHYQKKHPDAKDIDLADAYSLTFIDKPRKPKDLDVLESVWIRRLSANINICKTILPKF